MVKLGYGISENYSTWVSTRIVVSAENCTFSYLYNLRVHDKILAKQGVRGKSLASQILFQPPLKEARVLCLDVEQNVLNLIKHFLNFIADTMN